MTAPISMEEARRQLKLESDDTSQDDQIAGYIRDAAAWVEDYTGHILEARDVTEEFVGFGALRLRAWPIAVGVVPVVTYDAGGVTTPAGTARAAGAARPATVFPAGNARWPNVAASTPVTVTVRAGYETPADVPGNFKRAMLVLIGAYDADREGGEVFQAAEKSARALCGRKRARAL